MKKALHFIYPLTFLAANNKIGKFEKVWSLHCASHVTSFTDVHFFCAKNLQCSVWSRMRGKEFNVYFQVHVVFYQSLVMYVSWHYVFVSTARHQALATGLNLRRRRPSTQSYPLTVPACHPTVPSGTRRGRQSCCDLPRPTSQGQCDDPIPSRSSNSRLSLASPHLKWLTFHTLNWCKASSVDVMVYMLQLNFLEQSFAVNVWLRGPCPYIWQHLRKPLPLLCFLIAVPHSMQLIIQQHLIASIKLVEFYYSFF